MKEADPFSALHLPRAGPAHISAAHPRTAAVVTGQIFFACLVLFVLLPDLILPVPRRSGDGFLAIDVVHGAPLPSCGACSLPVQPDLDRIALGDK